MDGALEDVPPSAKLVYTVLEHEGPLTQEDIAATSRLPRRTVRDALRRLREQGFVSRSIHIPDARKQIYQLADDPDEEP